ncbi:OmpP1/FadL family transporter [Rhizobium sp. SSA_523]|uniref:OmpP1/FadL family transporter n=1 Tax=Rhizobium sp. SSA_523 TaxID=2952477 RepID=UPI002091E060|nr:OmpP1/FadL family transporter [Rhizobium sp. SSA_523]MCO5734038.1 OmpP1/FadL family transporter [Rhizobium sp. SSA_523]WKC24678.1 OmpP1/FadL family transporter [Rhizobium sp. SSA_523]
MVRHFILRGLLATAAAGAVHASAFAGGLERGGYNIDLLFDPSSVAAESSATFVSPQRRVKNVQDIDRTDGLGSDGRNGGTTTADDAEGYWVPRVGVKAGIGDSADCMADYSQPWGAHTKPGANWRGANDNIETKVKSDNYAVTCSYRFDLGRGQLRVIGGGFYQEVSGFKERLVVPAGSTPFGNGIGRLELSGEGWGWRAGLAYEIPEYAFRTSLVYNSAVDLDDITGTLDLRKVNGRLLNVFGAQKMPDTLELKVQSGIAPNWLAFGSVKWVDWSQISTIPFCVVGTVSSCTSRAQVTSLDLGYRDGWTITGGIGHKFNEEWSGALSVTWDRGTSQGYGTQTDSWTVGAALSYAPTKNVELRLAGALGVLTSGSSGPVTLNGVNYGTDARYDFDDDLVAAISTSLKVKF